MTKAAEPYSPISLRETCITIGAKVACHHDTREKRPEECASMTGKHGPAARWPQILRFSALGAVRVLKLACPQPRIGTPFPGIRGHPGNVD